MKPQRNRARDIGFYVLILVLLACTLFTLLNQEPENNQLSYAQVRDLFKEEKVQEFTYNGSKNILEMKVRDSSAQGGTKTVYYKMYSFSLFYEEFGELIDQQYDKGIIKDYQIEPVQSTWWLQLIPYVLFIGFMVFWIVMMQRAQGGGGAGGAMKFGKARTRLGSEEKNRKTFNDVAGADEEKAELQELVEFLKDPKSFTKMGARIPKGVLLVGPPGTGKTLLAKAVAGEAGVQFLSISGSDFVELYVGVGASRVRDLFETARKSPASIVFIDEIDAVGRHRGAGLGGGHDEREQTLNQLLVEMDGFGVNEGIIVMAATNRPDVLDPALLRPGRFDRQITVNRPDAQGREDILKVHSRNKPLGPDVDLKEVAKDTIGFTGADLENLLNEAALLAVRRKKKALTMAEINDASSRVQMGTEKKSHKYSKKAKRLTAYHEAGHAVAAYYVEGHDPVKEISIIPRGLGAGGYTWYTPQEENYNSKKEMLDDLISMLGGRVAEALALGDISTGASNDLQRATQICRDMVAKYGMSEVLGPAVFSDENDEVFLGKDFGHVNNYSEATSAKIDAEIERMMRHAYSQTEEILKTHYDKLELVAETLLQKEKITGEMFAQLMENGKLDEPEAQPTEEPEAPAAETQTAADTATVPAPEGGDAPAAEAANAPADPAPEAPKSDR